MPNSTKKTNTRSTQKTVYIKPKLDKFVTNYISKKSDDNLISYSEVVNLALEKFFDIEATNESLNLTKEIIDTTIETHIKKYFNRMISLQVKNTKTGYSSIYLLSNLLATLYQTDDQRNFIKEKIKIADELRI